MKRGNLTQLIDCFVILPRNDPSLPTIVTLYHASVMQWSAANFTH